MSIRTRFNFSVVAVAASLVIYTSITYAEVVPSGGAEQTSGLDEIVVTAQRRSESLERTPVAVSVLTAEKLDQQGIKTLEDLQYAVSGVTVRATTSSSDLNFSIRGQTIDAFTFSPPAVQPYLNEVPQTSSPSSNFYDLQSIQILKGPQGTLFGRNTTGGAVLFTSAEPTNDFGGYVLNRFGNYSYNETQFALNIPIVSDKVLLRLAGDFDRKQGFINNLYDGSKLGDEDQHSLRGTLSVRPFDGLTNSLVFNYGEFHGAPNPAIIYSGYAPASTNHGIPLYTTGSTLFSPLLDTVVNLPGAYAAYTAANPGVDSKGIYSYLLTQQARGPFNVSLNAPDFQKTNGIFLSNITTWDVTPDLKVKNIFGFANSDITKIFDPDGSPFLIQNQHSIVHNRQYTEELQFLGNALSNNLTYVTGLYYEHGTEYQFNANSFYDLSPIIPPGSENFYFNLISDTYAGYAQGTYDLSSFTGVQGLGVTAGVRYTYEREEEDVLPGSAFYNIPGLPNDVSDGFHKLSYQFGIQNQIDPNLLTYIVTRRSFRSGGFNAFSIQTPGDASQGGNAFNPETATDVELGVKFVGKVGGAPYAINVAVYREWVDNVQRALYGTTPDGGIASFTANVPQAIVEGVELDGHLALTSWLDVGGNLTYTDAEFSKSVASVYGQATTYGPYADTPRWSGAAYSQVNFPRSDWLGTPSVRADAYSQSVNYFGSLNNTVTPGTAIRSYTLVNFRAGLADIAKSHVSVAAYVKNAFNRVYYSGGDPTGEVYSFNEAVVGSPRTYYGEVKYQF